jgi:hypothetical protein
MVLSATGSPHNRRRLPHNLLNLSREWRFLQMAPQIQPDTRADHSISQSHPQAASSWECPGEAASRLADAVDRFLNHPGDDPATDEALSAINNIAGSGPGGKRALESVRRKRLKRDGGFGCRYVAVKWLDADGEFTALSEPVPARDLIRSQMARIVAERPEQFPDGVDAFFENERPLLQARTADFASLVAGRVRRELTALAADPPIVSHTRLASILDLMLSYRHVAQIRAAAHPRALEKIDTADTASMSDFLIAVAGRLPLTTAEFDRFLELARADWVSDAEKDAILRGRVVTLGLDGKSALLLSWITPFTRELAARGLLGRVSGRYRAARHGQRKPEVIQPPGASPGSSVLEHDTQEMAASDTAIHYLEGAPEPARMHVLRNYLRCSTICAIVSLDEALRIAEASSDVPGHRQHVIRLFHDEGWIMTPRRHGEPVFEKRATPQKADGTTAHQ